MLETEKKGRLLTGRRGKAFLVIVPLVLGALVTRLFFIQVLWGHQLGALALSTRTVTEEIPASRGKIYDRNHNLLVGNEPASSVYADPGEIKHPDREAAALAPYLGLPAADLEKELAGRNDFVWLAHDLPFTRADQLKKLNLPGIYFLPGERRLYPQGDLAAQVLGFAGQGERGLVGLEESYNDRLTGQPGSFQVQIGADGRPILQTMRQLRPPTPGDSLVLTIDENIQFLVEQELDQIVQKYQPDTATIIVMDPRTGDILAMGSRPTFDPSNWQASPEQVWDGDPAVLNAIEPGSVFKIVTAAAALEEGMATPDSRYSYPGYIVVQGRRINDWNYAVDNDQTLSWAFANSYNPVFARLGLDLGAARFYRYVDGFGFGRPTGIDLPGEALGIVKPEDRATPLDLATMGIGQGISITPLQMLTAACAVADGGYLMQPRLVKEVVDGAGKIVQDNKPLVVRQVVSAATAGQVMDMMRLVATIGTGGGAAIPGYSVAGKTGTAQVPGPGGYQAGRYVSSFVGFTPASHPAFGMLVVIDDPKGGQYYGGEVAGPYFSDLGAKILHYLNVPYDLPLPSPPATNPAPAPSPPAPPDLLGYPVSYARQILAQWGFNTSVSGRGPLVTGEHPGTTVILDTGPLPGPGEAVTVPDLSGLSVKLAGDVLASLGLHLQVQGGGLASRQAPAAGSKVGAGSTVQVQFSQVQGF